MQSEMTSQGMRREEALIEAKKPHDPVVEESSSVLGGLWSQIRAAGEKIVEQTKELALNVEHQVEAGAEKAIHTLEDSKEAGAHMIDSLKHTAEEKTEQIKVLGSTTLADATEKSHGLTEVVAEQSQVVGEQAKEKANEIISSETVHSVVSAGSNAFEHAKEMAGEAYEQAKELAGEILASDAAQTAVTMGSNAIEQAKEKTNEILASDTAQSAISVGSSVFEQAKEKTNEILASEPAQSAISVGSSVVEQAKEKANEIFSSDAAQTAISVGSSTLAQARSLGQQAVAAGQHALEHVHPASTEQQKTMSAGEIFIEQAQAQLNSLAQQALNVGQQVVGTGPVPLSRSDSKRSMKRSASGRSVDEDAWNGQPLTLTMDVVSHIQRIADRTGDAVLHETARKAHSTCAKGANEAPGVHLVWITLQQANDLVNLAIRTQDHELADFARYCQSVAATTHVGVEPSPGKIQQEILKGHQELHSQGRVHTGPGYGAAFASVNRVYNNVTPTPQPVATQPTQEVRQESASQPPKLELTMDVVSHVQRIADRTGNEVLHDTARKAHSACAKGLSDAPGVHLVWITPQQASELMNIASRTQDAELINFARYCQSVASTTQVGVEPEPGKIQQEILKGRRDLQKLGVDQEAALVDVASANAAM